MRSWTHNIVAFFLCPSAWLIFAAVLAATGWIARGDTEELMVAGATSLLCFCVVAMRAVSRRRYRAARRAVETASSEMRLLEVMLDRLPGIVWRSDPESRRTFASTVWTSMTDHAQADGLEQRWLAAVHPDDRDRCLAVPRIAAAAREHYDLLYRLGQGGGRYRWVCDHAAPCSNDDDVFCGYVGVTLPVDGEVDEATAAPPDKSIVDRFTRRCDTITALAVRVADRFEDFKDEKERADYADRLKCDYLAALGNELRAVVEELASAAELIRATDLDETTRTNLDRIASAQQHLARLVERAVELAVPVRNADDLEECDFDLRELIDGVMRRQQAVADERGLKIDALVENSVPGLVHADPLRLRRMLTELWTTALRLPRKGRLVFRVAPDSTTGSGDRVSFSIALPSAAVAPELIERAYYPVETIGGEAPGLGLGPCKRLADAMGAKLGIQEDSRDHIVFWITLDLAPINPNWDGRRSHGRLAQESVRSSLGTVLDLSLGGMRVRCTKVPNDEVDIKLWDAEESIELRGELCWSRRTGFGKHEAGFKFIDPDDEVSGKLGRLAARNRLRRVLEVA
jgi:PAS domain-containing protein